MILPAGPAPTGYRELAALLRAQITSGELGPGQALPSERALRETYGLGKGAVRDAITMLRGEGLIVVRRGYGAVVREQIEWEEIVPEPDSVVETRMPSPQERKMLEQREGRPIPDGVPVWHVVGPQGDGDLYPGDRYRLRIPQE